MTCEGCEKTVEDTLKLLSKVTDVKASAQAGTITVTTSGCNSCKVISALAWFDSTTDADPRFPGLLLLQVQPMYLHDLSMVSIA